MEPTAEQRERARRLMEMPEMGHYGEDGDPHHYLRNAIAQALTLEAQEAREEKEAQIASLQKKVRMAEAGEMWVIEIGGYGAWYFIGTEAEAEEMRSHKAEWEAGVGRKTKVLDAADMAVQLRKIAKARALSARQGGEK